MQQTQERESSSSASQSGLIDQDEQPGSSQYYRSRQSIEEARQMLDEIAFGGGVIDSEAERPHPRQTVDPARIVRGVLLSPLSLLKFFFKLIAILFKRADFALLQEMRKFLAHPGHFFWFNRLAPQAAARHFGTSSTEAMTHHARRFGAHTAMLLLAIMVVAFGGFSGLTRPVASPEEMQAAPDGSTPYGTLAQIGNMHEIFITAINSGTAAPRRTKIHEVAAGDTIKKLAERYGISLNSILYANLLVDPDATLQLGQKLLIPPTTGMLHIANQGDTIGKLADMYQVDPLTIINYPLNNLAGADIKTQLPTGQEVIVPNGAMPQRDKLYIYTTKPGDTVSSVAAKFGISTYTLRVANDLDNTDGLLADVELDILPISGIQYTIRAGDTLQGIATRYSVPLESIVNYAPNNVAKGLKLETGRTIIIPNGIIPAPPPTPRPQPTATPKPAAPAPAVNNAPKPATNNNAPKPATSTQKQPATQAKQPSLGSSGSVAKSGSSAPAPSNAVATGSMMWPMRGIITTYFGQRIWYGIHMGLDIATGCGAPVVASDGGTVIESGWSPYGYGINVQIDHGRGIVTRYGHFMATKVAVGQRVAKGQLIGLEGTTGNSTGCHVHFEVKVNGSYTDPLGWIR